MKKVIIALMLIAGIAIAVDQTFTIDTGETSASITNTSVGQRWYLKSVYALQDGAVADVVSLKKTSGSTDVVIVSQTMTTNAVDVNIVLTVPSTVYLTYGEIAKVVRADTNNAITGFIVTDAE